MIGLYSLIVLIILAALAAVESRSLLVSVAAFGLTGLGFSLTYIIMGSWDLALIQLAVELGLLFYLIRSTHIVSETETYAGRRLGVYLGALAFASIFLYFAYFVLRSLPPAIQLPGAIKLPSLYEVIGIAAALLAAVVGGLTVLRPEDEK